MKACKINSFVCGRSDQADQACAGSGLMSFCSVGDGAGGWLPEYSSCASNGGLHEDTSPRLDLGCRRLA